MVWQVIGMAFGGFLVVFSIAVVVVRVARFAHHRHWAWIRRVRDARFPRTGRGDYR